MGNSLHRKNKGYSPLEYPLKYDNDYNRSISSRDNPDARLICCGSSPMDLRLRAMERFSSIRPFSKPILQSITKLHMLIPVHPNHVPAVFLSMIWSGGHFHDPFELCTEMRITIVARHIGYRANVHIGGKSFQCLIRWINACITPKI